MVRDTFTGEIIEDDEEFIDALTHEGLYIQMPYLKDKRRNEIEKVLSVFDVTQGKTHFFDIDEHEYPEEHQDIIRRLRQACSEKQIRDTMICEDEVLAELADMERAIANKDKEVEEIAKELREKDKELACQKKEHAATLKRAVKKLAKAMGISEDEAGKMLTS